MEPRRDVSAINPEAGSYLITSDPREIEAALRAAERSWQQFPYYEWRYGERGRRFVAGSLKLAGVCGNRTHRRQDQLPPTRF